MEAHANIQFTSTFTHTSQFASTVVSNIGATPKIAPARFGVYRKQFTANAKHALHGSEFTHSLQHQAQTPDIVLHDLPETIFCNSLALSIQPSHCGCATIEIAICGTDFHVAHYVMWM
jgi:hypothetical protein